VIIIHQVEEIEIIIKIILIQFKKVLKPKTMSYKKEGKILSVKKNLISRKKENPILMLYFLIDMLFQLFHVNQTL